MPKMTAIFSTAFLSLGLLAGVAHAQGPAESSPPQAAGMAAAPVEFSDSQLQKFADASEDIVAVSEEYTARLHAAGDDAEQREIRTEANTRMIEVVEEHGLEVE